MIHLAVPEAGAFSLRSYLADEGLALSARMRVVPYETFLVAPVLETGTWVFAAIDHLQPAGVELVAAACDALAARDGRCRVLNDPRRVLLRPALLNVMHHEGINRFRAFTRAQLSEPGVGDGLRYPVFIREANRHTGNLGPLLRDDAELHTALVSLRLRGHRMEDLLIVEFCDTADEQGVYRKYSAFRVGDAILPRYLNFSTHWMIKHNTRLYDLERADEELAYLYDNPHEAWLRRVFDVAGIEYGRIDYGLLGDVPQLWEINTNPTIGRVGPPRRRPPDVEAYRSRIAPGRALFYERFTEAWQALDATGAERQAVPFSVSVDLRRRHASETRTQERRQARRRLYDRIAGYRLVRTLRRFVQPAVVRVSRAGIRRP